MSAGPQHSSAVHCGYGTIKQKSLPSFLGQLSWSAARHGAFCSQAQHKAKHARERRT